MIGIKCNMSIKSQNRDINQTIHSSLMGQAKNPCPRTIPRAWVGES